MKTYEVTGGARYMGHKPGKQFDADLDPTVEARAIKRGSIKVAGEAGDTPVEAPTGDNPDPDSLDLGNGPESVAGGKE